ncbi:DUF559 domain-containing protein [bacterium]|nr:MAG: DUF559 domain-containing protein [bacterium]
MSTLRRNYAPENLEKARTLRKGMSRAEKRLWYDGLDQRRQGFYFRRQYPLGPYFLDFYCAETNVCIEVDGAQHEFSADYDTRRDRWLSENGILTLRFAADSVMLDLPHILWKIEEACKPRTPTLPSPSGEGEATSLEGCV